MCSILFGLFFSGKGGFWPSREVLNRIGFSPYLNVIEIEVINLILHAELLKKIHYMEMCEEWKCKILGLKSFRLLWVFPYKGSSN